VCQQNVLGAAQDVEQSKRKSNSVSLETVRIRRAVAGRRHGGVEAGPVVAQPWCPAVGQQDLRIGEAIRLSARLAAVAFAARVRAITSAPTGRRSAS
jgi:hypothetical protein